MSGGSYLQKKVWPYTSYSTIIRFIDIVAKYDSEGVTKEKLQKILQLSKSSISNVLPTLKSLGLIELVGYRHRTVRITSDGLNLSLAHSKGDIEATRELALRIVGRSPVLSSAYSVLRHDPAIGSRELAVRVGRDFHKTWTTQSSYRHVGRSMIDILSGLRLMPEGIYHRINRRRYRGPSSESLVPSVPAEGLFDYVSILDLEEAKSVVRPEASPRERSATMDRFRSLIDLGLAIPVGDMSFRLSPIGERIKRSIENRDSDELSELFSSVILAHPVSRRAIEKLSRMNIGVGWQEIGEEIAEENRRTWKENTKRIMGSRFLTWLRVSNIAKPNHEHGKYRINVPTESVAVRISEPMKVEVQGDRAKTAEMRGADAAAVGATRTFIVEVNRVLVSDDSRWNEDRSARERMLKAIAVLEHSLSPIPNFIPVMRRRVEKAFLRKDLDDLKDAALLAHELDQRLFPKTTPKLKGDDPHRT